MRYLDIYLDALRPHLAAPDVTDLYVNRPGEVWIERLGGAIERIAAPAVDEALLWRLAQQIAGLTHQGVNREHPLLAGTLPDGARVQVVAPPATRGPMALAIRKHLSSELTLRDYAAAGAFATTGVDALAAAADARLAARHAAGDWPGFLAEAVRARRTILVSGGTASGKTTFVNALLREVDPAERLILIEDTPELVLHHPSMIGLVAVRGALAEARVTADDLLIAALRLRPDRIILGELRGTEAFAFLRAVNTGHPGSLSTIHADSPAGAIEQLALLVLQTGTPLRREDVVHHAAQTIDVIVQLERRGGRRRIADIAWHRAPAGKNFRGGTDAPNHLV